MRHGSLFSGIGGFDLAAEWMGWENVFQVEKDEWCQKVLKKNFPNTKRYGDIKQFNGIEFKDTIDILSGGFPCQPFSIAGKRKGKDDDRYLWPEMLRIIGEIKPQFVVGENVNGLNGLVLEELLTNLEDGHYSCEVFNIPACSVNAPHRRERIWIIGYANSSNALRKKYSGQQDNDIKIRSTEKNIKKRINWIDELVPGNATQGFDSYSGALRILDGIPARVDRLTGLGNAIVPQVAFEIFKAIESTMGLTHAKNEGRK